MCLCVKVNAAAIVVGSKVAAVLWIEWKRKMFVLIVGCVMLLQGLIISLLNASRSINNKKGSFLLSVLWSADSSHPSKPS